MQDLMTGQYVDSQSEIAETVIWLTQDW